MEANEKQISVNKSNDAELKIIREIAQSRNDCPVLMLNLNKYKAEAGFPGGRVYKDYMKVLSDLLPCVGGRILWRTNIQGTLVGTQHIHEALGIWYPSHQAFLDIMTAPSAARNMELRTKAVEHADLHRCDPY